MKQRTDPMHERYLAHIRSRRVSTIVGIIAIALGYSLLAVPPDTSQEWVLVRVVLGFIFILVGFVMAVVPLLGSLFGTND
ncbi:MAG: hypothetical protein PHQ60_11805 [Sideroxydans sp.]|nr:hypothetical protein [Sideroxydans sp.]